MLLKFKYYFSNEIREPFAINRKEFKNHNSSLEVILKNLFPRKYKKYAPVKKNALFINLMPRGPIGLSGETLTGQFLGPDFHYHLRQLKNSLGLEELLVAANTGLKQESDFFSPVKPAQSLVNEYVTLDEVETSQLFSLLEHGSYADGHLITIFRSPDDIFSCHVPRDITLEQLAEKEGLSVDNEKIYFYHPLSGDKISLQDNVCDYRSLILAPPDQFEVRAVKKSLLFPFPYYNRRLSLFAAGKASQAPVKNCNNCLCCVRYCPEGLVPNYIYHLSVKDQIDELDNYRVDACSLCGNCSLVCPAGLPMWREMRKHCSR